MTVVNKMSQSTTSTKEDLGGARVCMLTAAHDANDDRIFFKEARSLAHLGADVVVVCHGAKSPPTHTDGVRFRHFPKCQGWGQRLRGVSLLARTAAAERYDVIHCHEPDALVAALRLKQATGAKVIYDSHESWGAVFAERLPAVVWRPAQVLFQAWETRLIRRCDAAIGASWTIADYLRKLLPADRVATVLNVPVPEVFGEVPPRTWGETTVLCHDGHLGFDHGLKTMAMAAHEVSRRHPIVFQVVGDVFGEAREWLDAYVAEHGLRNVIQRTGWLPYEQVGRHIAACQIGLIAYQHLPNNVVTSSNKVFNYMLYGLPFIGPDFRLAKIKLVAEERCGLLADSASPPSYARAITQMIENREETLAMGQRALKASREKYRWEHMEAALLQLYQRVLGR